MDLLSLAYESDFIKSKPGELQKQLNISQFAAKPTLALIKEVETFND
jgi:hypothetical protein